MPHFTQQGNSQDDPISIDQTQSSYGDIPFLGLITTGLLGGVILIIFDLPALAPSIFFGSAVSGLVHRYLGGIKPSDAAITTGIGKLGGTLASLVLTTIIFNSVLEKQMVSIDLSVNPTEHNLVVLERDNGNAVNVVIRRKGGLGNNQKSIQVNQAALEEIKQICRKGEGFCKEPVQKVEFSVNSKLKDGFARICRERDDLDSYPLMFLKQGKKTEAFRAIAYSNLNCFSGENEAPLQVEIGQKDAERAGIHSGDQGWASMARLKEDAREENLYIENENQTLANSK